MKTNKILLGMLAMATLSLASCSSEEIESARQPQEKTAKLELTLLGTPAESRATGTLPTDDEVQINRLTVAVFTAASDNPVNALKEFTGKEITNATSGTGKVISLLCEPGNGQSVYVVANAESGLFAGVSNLKEFKEKLMLLSETTKSAGAGAATDAQLANNLPMVGTATSQNLTAGKESQAAISLSRLVARVSISSIKTDFEKTGQFKDATFKVTGIYLKNANSAVNVEKTGSKPINGDATTNKYLYNAVTNATAITTPYYFYTFPNTSTTTPTKLIIKGLFDADGTGTKAKEVTCYYPIVINKQQANTDIKDDKGVAAGNATGSIASNTKYVLTATIKGEGVDDDSKDINPATLKLTVTVADWLLTISQDVTFN